MSGLPKNQELSIEEILTAIRRQTAGSQVSGDSGGAQMTDAIGKVRNGRVAAWNQPVHPAAVAPANDDAEDGELDLPSLFSRPEPARPETDVHRRRRPIATRLTDALRSASIASAPSRPDGPAGDGPEGTLPRSAGPDGSPPVARKMVSFMDTRFKQMGQAAVPALPPPTAEAPQQQPASNAHDQLTPSASPALPSDATWKLAGNAVADIGAALPAELLKHHNGAAELLRPLLKDWLNENMPRMVEKALSSEAAQTRNRQHSGLDEKDEK